MNTPPGLLNQMSQCIPNSSEVSMTQLYEEIRNYYQSHSPEVTLGRPPLSPSMPSTGKLIRVIENLLDHTTYLKSLEFKSDEDLLTRRQKTIWRMVEEDISEAEELLVELRKEAGF